MEKPGSEWEGVIKTGSVAEGILSKFFDALKTVEELAEIAPGLRKTVLEDGIFAEPAVRAALFPDAQ